MTRAIRNIAIIAHVDHGKTTLVDQLLQCAGTFRENQQVAERVMDSNAIERERGITILAKNCAVEYEGVHINIIDTPGHADFGGEVERVLSMVDGVLLLVDAVEGPMPQTRFVTRKALAQGLKPIVVINKIDRPGARPDWVLNQTFDLFDKLGATEEQLDFPVIYASALNGFAGETDDVICPDLAQLRKIGNMRAIFDTVIKHVPVRDDDPDGGLMLQICSLDYSSYVGKIGVGRVHRGRIRAGQEVAIMDGPEDKPKRAKINQILVFEGLERKKFAHAVEHLHAAAPPADAREPADHPARVEAHEQIVRGHRARAAEDGRDDVADPEFPDPGVGGEPTERLAGNRGRCVVDPPHGRRHPQPVDHLGVRRAPRLNPCSLQIGQMRVDADARDHAPRPKRQQGQQHAKRGNRTGEAHGRFTPQTATSPTPPPAPARRKRGEPPPPRRQRHRPPKTRSSSW